MGTWELRSVSLTWALPATGDHAALPLPIDFQGQRPGTSPVPAVGAPSPELPWMGPGQSELGRGQPAHGRGGDWRAGLNCAAVLQGCESLTAVSACHYHS